MLKQLFKIIDQKYICPRCCSNELYLVDDLGNKLNYSKVMNSDNIDHIINTNVFYYIACEKCGSKFIIDWRNYVPEIFL